MKEMYRGPHAPCRECIDDVDHLVQTVLAGDIKTKKLATLFILVLLLIIIIFFTI